jgi:hypothetical protein
MNSLEKIAAMVEEAESNTFDTMVEEAHTKIAMLDDVTTELEKAANFYESEELMKVAEVLGAMVLEEAAEIDDTMAKIAEMASAGPTTAGLLEKRAGDSFEENLAHEAERIKLLSDISDFVKEAAAEADDEALNTIGDAVGDIAESDAEALEAIAKEAGIMTGAKEWLASKASKAKGYLTPIAKGEEVKGALKDLKGMKGSQFRFMDKASRSKAIAAQESKIAKAKAKIEAVKALASGSAGKMAVKGNRSDLAKTLLAGAKGAGKTGLLYGVPAAGVAGAGYGTYRTMKK